MNQTSLDIIEEKVNSVQKNLDLHIADTDKELSDIQQLRVQVATLIETVNGLEKTVNRQSEKVTNRFAQAVEPILEESQNLRNTINKKKFKILKQPFKWKFWKGD